jgi:hypothetical protein
MGGACSTYGEKNVYRVSVGKPDGKILLGRPAVSARIILEWILKGMCGRRLNSSGSSGGCCVNTNEHTF